MSSELKARLQTAFFLIPLVLFCIYMGGSFFMILLLGAGVVGFFELWRLAEGTSVAPLVLHVLTLGIVLASLMEKLPFLALFCFLLGLLLTLAISWRQLLFPLLIIPVAALFVLREAPLGMEAVLWFFVTISACDTGAYFAGRFYGGAKLAAKLSPQKTWSGLLGGLAAAFLAGAVMAFLFSHPRPIVFMMLSVLLGMLSQIGDLVQSSLKRYKGVKDTGQIFPGHGGVLDRCDGLLFTLLVFSPMILSAPQGAAQHVLFWS